MSTPAKADPRQRVRWIAGFTLAAASLGFLRLGSKDVWLDEAASAGFALGAPESWFADHNMALYYALLAGWVRVFGYDPFALRSLSAVCFVASVPVFYLLAEALFTQSVARVASALYVANALFVHLAQEARGYMLALLLVILSQLALMRLLERRSWPAAILLGVVQGLSVYAHLFAALVALAQTSVIVVFAGARADLPRLKLSAAYGSSAAIVAPLALQVASAGAGQVSWLFPPSLARSWGALVVWSGGSAILAVALAALCVWFALRASSSTEHPLARPLVFAWLSLPIVLSVAFSVFVAPIVHPKYLCVSVPALLLAAAAGLERLPAPKWRAVVLLALLGLSSQRLHFWYAHYQKERWNEVAALIAAQQRPGDALVLDVMGPEAFHYSLEQLDLVARVPQLWPRSDWYSAARHPSRVWLIQNRARDFEVAKALPNHAALWTRRFEPLDEDADSLFADSGGRIIQLTLFQR